MVAFTSKSPPLPSLLTSLPPLASPILLRHDVVVDEIRFTGGGHDLRCYIIENIPGVVDLLHSKVLLNVIMNIGSKEVDVTKEVLLRLPNRRVYAEMRENGVLCCELGVHKRYSTKKSSGSNALDTIPLVHAREVSITHTEQA